jgi:hypothetical protein
MLRMAFLIGSLLTACAPVGAGPPSGVPLLGQWGGTHIGLMLTPAGGTIEYDCASGSLTEPLIPRPDGDFSAKGTHTPGHGGPAMEGEILPVHRARFTGIVRGDRMTMTGRVENGILLGPFTLRRGAEAGIFRCL